MKALGDFLLILLGAIIYGLIVGISWMLDGNHYFVVLECILSCIALWFCIFYSW